MSGEDIIQFLWKHSLFHGKRLCCTCGLELVILNPGEHNFDAGPDFINARIKMGSLIWAGNVEVHQRSSDWYRHAHHINPSYNNVILHVVSVYDADIYNSQGRRIPTLVPDYPQSFIQRYQALKSNEEWLPCAKYLKDFFPHRFKLWLSQLLIQRSEQKSQAMLALLSSVKRQRETAFYLALASGFGLSLNCLPFELLSRGIPLQLIHTLQHKQEDLEALLFGHSGLLSPAKRLGSYPSTLWERYQTLRHHLPGKPVPVHLWKFLRLRPASFPTLRISQFAFILHQRMPLLESVMSAGSLSELEQLLRAKASTYWDNHYLFGKCSPPSQKHLGHQAVSTLIINVILPYLHVLENLEPRGKFAFRATDILAQMQAESNQIIHCWRSYGIRAENAGETQALLQLFNVYCKQKRCLHCQIGTGILEATLHEKK